MDKRFSYGEAIKYGFKILNLNFVFLATVYLIAVIISFIPHIANKYFLRDSPLLAAILIIGGSLLILMINLDLIKIAIKFCDGEKGTYNDLLSSSNLLLKYIAAKILYALIVIGGTILLIIPGIIWAIKYSFYTYLIVDKGLGPVEALKKSSEITKGARWNLFVFGIVMIALNIAGLICFGIGILVTLPVTQIAVAFVLRKLQSSHKSIEPQTEEVPTLVTER